MSLACLAASLIGCWPMSQILEDERLWQVAFLLPALSLAGLGLRVLRAPHGVAQVGQILLLGGWLAYLGRQWGNLNIEGLPTRIGDLVNQGVHHMTYSQAPMEPNAGTAWLLIALAGVMLVMTELFAITLEQPAWTPTSFALVYVVVAVGDFGIGWQHFVTLAAAYVLILATREAGVTQVPVGLTSDTAQSFGVFSRLGLGVVLAVPAIVFALLVSSVIPLGSFGDWLRQSLAPGAPLQLGDPSLDLSENLNRPADRPVLRYRTDAPNGLYLRLTTLSKLTASGMGLADVKILPGRPNVNLPAGAVAVRTQVSVGDFASEYLPVPYAPMSFRAAGSWGWEPNSLTILAREGNRRDATLNLQYEVSSRVFTPTANIVRMAKAGRPTGEALTAEVPADLPPSIKKLALQLTSGASTAGEAALAIQEYLRSGVFTYDTQAPAGSGFGVMESFLFGNRSGYCIHFATTMATMARVAGIPSRVAIGFLPGKQQPNGDWQVGSHAMHAWPELYFESIGWVAFEPTPAVANAPGWSQTDPVPSPTATPTASATPAPTTNAPQPPVTPSAAPAPQAPTSTGPSPLVFGWVVLALAVLAAPLAARQLLRRYRLRPTQEPLARAENAWWELRCLWDDHGLPWAKGSPRVAAQRLALELGGPGKEAIAELALAVERARYSHAPPDPGDLGKLVQAIRIDIPVSSLGERLRVLTLPRSLFLVWRNRMKRVN